MSAHRVAAGNKSKLESLRKGYSSSLQDVQELWVWPWLLGASSLWIQDALLVFVCVCVSTQQGLFMCEHTCLVGWVLLRFLPLEKNHRLIEVF